ncbi:BON domain protein [Planctomycetes bacterium CA13]|uniref:BON domain protein n=1 Tax=Novipirellula herctigrandis TaxID=2527986 RepID=A0A5C5Z000_9BACT|nr:BON domain protein [Planctomycetes bacterium CA13]
MNALIEYRHVGGETGFVVDKRAAGRIDQDVRAKLESAHQPALRAVSCEFRQGVLQLRGRVDSFYLKQLAQEQVRRVDGVTSIINNIYVVGPANLDKNAPD